jgi:hypothetical protein
MMLPASEMLVPIYSAKSARILEKDEVRVREMEGKKKWDAGIEEREKEEEGGEEKEGKGERERRRKESERKTEEE